MDVRQVGLLVYTDGNMVDIGGPPQVFASAARIAARLGIAGPGYETRLFSLDGGLVHTSSGIAVDSRPLAQATRQSWDTFLVTGGFGVERMLGNPAIAESLRTIAPLCRRFGSICSGALLLQEAGLLAGRRVVTHWRHCDDLKARDPSLNVERDAIFVEDQGLWTSAGVTAGMDMALAMVERDLGRAVALQTAREMVLFLKRPGGQSQFSSQLASQITDHDRLGELAQWVLANCQRRLTVTNLADFAGMSPRNFARVFAEEFGVTPARFVEKARVEAARRRLEDSRAALDQVAPACGFSSADHMRRAFLRHLACSPSAYRERFSPTPRTEKAS